MPFIHDPGAPFERFHADGDHLTDTGGFQVLDPLVDFSHLLAADRAVQAPEEDDEAEAAALPGAELQIIGGSPAHQGKVKGGCCLRRNERHGYLPAVKD
ncbi:hypothetical protein J2X98_003153 [Pseudarthrobacter enclensis]|uniref:SGNH domain-containing protein n=1 Tax=Pseudarthrobacter enclensis TaxID=993070 RepID=A0ABT9RWU5_9MICC|nr:hypothetical protein [Pseudarthrobacter enclensis]MDP9889542.1 hypothetical protein [Pseudarthrobacter enclensis]